MAKVTAPILSFAASGTIAKTATFAKWRGVAYARQRVVPANPQTTDQQFVRRTFALLREMWKLAPQALIDPWDAFASGRPFTGMNKYVGENVRVLNGDLNMDDWIGSPGARGGLPPDSVVLSSPIAGKLVGTFTVPAAPTGWAITNATLVAFKNQPPDGIFDGVISAATDVSAPYAPEITGLTSAEEYVAAGWLVWEKPDGMPAYSVGLTGTFTIS